MHGTLITVAPTGAEHLLSEVPEIPADPDRLAEVARACSERGAAMIHVHVRDSSGAPTLDAGILAEHVAAVREASDLIIQLSTGGSVHDPFEDRLRVLELAPDSCSVTLGSTNFGADVFLNPWGLICDLHLGAREQRVTPEFEVFDLGALWTLRRLIDEHGPTWNERVHVDLVLGVPGAAPGTAHTLAAMVAALPDFVTSWSATGIGRSAIPVLLASLAHDGNLRVGLEDTVWLERGQRATNEALVQRASDLAAAAQRPALSTLQARDLLGIRPSPRTNDAPTRPVPGAAG